MDIIVIMDTIITQKHRKIDFIIIFPLLCFILFFVTGCGNDKYPAINESNYTTEIDAYESTDSIHRMTIEFQGKRYVYNDHLTNMVIMGVDNTEIPETSVGNPSSGQADTIYLVSYDRVTGNTNIISIPRDTIATFDLYDRDGTPLGPTTQQISLSYAFGDGKHESCRNTKEAVSRLFYRIPIQGYCSLTLEAMEKICEIFGTITVKIPNDSLVSAYPEMYKGAVVDITEENAEIYLRYRDTSVSHSALDRSERHNAFLKAFEEQVLFKLQQNPEQAADAYTEFEPYMITNIGVDQFVDISTKLGSGADIINWTIPGEAVTTNKYDEFHVNEEALYEKIIYSFFEEVTGE